MFFLIILAIVVVETLYFLANFAIDISPTPYSF